MGSQLAILFASKGFSVKLWNHRYQPNFQAEFSRLAKIQARLGLIDKSAVPSVIDLVSYTNKLTDIADYDFILESVIEDKAVKMSLFCELSQIGAFSGIVASNTSTISITELASITNHPDRCIGLHFFNPPLSMKLVEIINGELTSVDTLQLALDVIDKLGKQTVVLPESPGFIVNRLLFPMINEAVFLLSDGVADAKTIDRSMRLGANHPMGPLELADLIGLDVCLSILQTLVEETGDGKYRPAPLLKKFVRANKLGKKSGCGFYPHKIK